MKKEVFSPENFSRRIRIEPIKASEIDQFMAIAHEAIKDEPIPKEFEETIGESIRERTKDYYRTALSNPREWSLLAAKDTEGKIIGVLEARIMNMYGRGVELVNLVGVSKDKRRQGVAMDLCQACELILKNRKDVSGIMSGVFNTNTPSVELHKKFGMTKISKKLMHDKAEIYYKALR